MKRHGTIAAVAATFALAFEGRSVAGSAADADDAGQEAAKSSASAARAAARAGVITRIDTTQKRVAITFDACATKTRGYGFDRAIYQILQREQIPATLFVSGRWVELHPDVMTELAADPLIEFGDHSFDHPHMTKIGPARVQMQIDETEAALARYGKRSVAFRPPFGEFNERVAAEVRGRGLPVVLWDVVSGDPSAATTTRGIIEVVGRETRPGSIVISS